MPVSPIPIEQYHVFLASPGDMERERKAVRKFFEEYNLTTASRWGVRFEVVDWKNYSTIGVGRPQELITNQTLERFRSSLALVIGLMGQRFGSPTGEAESGTEEEFNWAFDSYRESGFPEVKWFFRKVEIFQAPSDFEKLQEAVEQWNKVRPFRERFEKEEPPIFYCEYEDSESFPDIFRRDLSLWLSAEERPWRKEQETPSDVAEVEFNPPSTYFSSLYEDFHWLDIAGIDNERTFRIPLSEIYVRLRVIFDEDTLDAEKEDYPESGPLDIRTALEHYSRLVIVGDPGSGKSTFLKFIALQIARSSLEDNTGIATETLSLGLPLPIPIFVSCWDLSDFLRKHETATVSVLVEFLTERLAAFGYEIDPDGVDQMLESGGCCLLVDGLDEVPTDSGRAMVSRLIEECVQHYSKNRYVVTSRVRAYTGDTILKGDFTRCDIQPFDEEDRRQFLRNWFALLLQVSPENVLKTGNESRREFDSLANAIEGNDRISTLAVNPLLLTVISIVHWNRKRLPEQRVELYGECVDVLLGQRKEAERVQLGKRTEVLDVQKEEKTYEDRAWIRKRFSEIALKIQQSEGEEITKGDIIALLVPRFRDRDSVDAEKAAHRAELFLERQELRSGLLVSRRAQNYRFVHLTFQEYLAALNLANQDFEAVKDVITPHLREQRWFEPLQLLGGEWANKSDEFLDRLVAFLLDNLGDSITDQAPIVALCANILKDAAGISEIKSETRRAYRIAVEDTLDAFRERSGVAVETQLEILEALGKLGSAVKDHLIAATKSSNYPVRKRAIEMLMPHLSDDDLFSMEHVFGDRSRHPIISYLDTLLERDVPRTVRLLMDVKADNPRVIAAISELILKLVNMLTVDDLLEVCDHWVRTPHDAWEHNWYKFSILETIAHYASDSDKMYSMMYDAATGVTLKNSNRRQDALHVLVDRWPSRKETWDLVQRIAKSGADPWIRRAAAIELIRLQEKGNP